MALTSVFGDENTVNIESRVLETFDNGLDSPYEWRAAANRFATKTDEETFPKVSYVATWPAAVFGNNRDGVELKSLGIWGKFDRQGYNWIDVYPVAAGGDENAEPEEIPIPGRVQSLDMWVWGSGLNYSIEAYVRDYRGIVHTINLGNLGFAGWRNMRASIPTNIPQTKRTLPRLASLSFVKFRIWTQPTEQVANFYIYFDQLRVVTDTFESQFDGNELSDPAEIERLWSADSGNDQGGDR
jgi:hypothetical protein